MLQLLKRIFSVTKKATLVFIVFFFIISLFVYFMNQDKLKLTVDPAAEGRKNIYKIINDKELNSTKEGKMFIAIYRLMNCRFVGEACTDNPSDGDKNYEQSIIGFSSKLVMAPYTSPPASGIAWVQDGLADAGFLPKIYAAEGVGFAALKPFIKIWLAFRNFTFIILVLVLVAIGFMIMFRMKINQQTVLSVENALPRIVIAMLLITFSYAIAGFMIDIMYIMMLLVISVLSTVNEPPTYVPSNAYNLINQYFAAGPTKLFPLNFNWLDTGNYLLSILPGFGNVLKAVGGFLTAFGLSRLILHWTDASQSIKGLKDLAISAAGFGISIGDIPEWITMIIYWVLVVIFSFFSLPLVIGFLVALTVLLIWFRLFFMLITTYIQVLLLILFSPIILVFEAIPGRGSFNWWIKNLFGNLVSFPFVMLIIMISDIIIKINTQVGQDKFWSPPFLYPLDQTAITFLFGLGLYLILPDFVKIIKEFLGVKPLPLTIGISTFFAGTGAFFGAQGGLGAITSLTQVPFLGPMVLNKIRQSEQGSKILQNILGPTEGELMARELNRIQKEKGKL